MGDLCVIKSRHLQCKDFHRAKLLEKQSGHTFKAVYLDIGSYVDNIESVHIFKLIDDFKVGKSKHGIIKLKPQILYLFLWGSELRPSVRN